MTDPHLTPRDTSSSSSNIDSDPLARSRGRLDQMIADWRALADKQDLAADGYDVRPWVWREAAYQLEDALRPKHGGTCLFWDDQSAGACDCGLAALAVERPRPQREETKEDESPRVATGATMPATGSTAKTSEGLLETVAYQAQAAAGTRPCAHQPCDQEFPGMPSRWCSGCLIAALLKHPVLADDGKLRAEKEQALKLAQLSQDNCVRWMRLNDTLTAQLAQVRADDTRPPSPVHGLYRCRACGSESTSELTVQCAHPARDIERIPPRADVTRPRLEMRRTHMADDLGWERMDEKLNFHAIIGPNGMCLCGVDADGTVTTCGQLLEAYVQERLAADVTRPRRPLDETKEK